MKKLILPLALAFIVGQFVMPVQAQTDKKPVIKTTKTTKKKPLKNEFSKLRRARKKDHTVRQITVDPNKLQAFKIPINKVVAAVRDANQEGGGRLLFAAHHLDQEYDCPRPQRLQPAT